MKSVLYVSRELKELTKEYNNIIVYGAGVWGRYCKEFLDSCHIFVECFVVSGDDGYEEGETINNIPIYCIKNFPFNNNMTIKNTLFIIAVNDRYIKEVLNNLQIKLGKVNYYIYSRKFKRPYIGITTVVGCRVNCSYCPQEVFIRKYCANKNAERTLTFKEYQRILSNVPNEVQINFAGFSEPFLNKEAEEMILYTVQKGHNVEVFTTMVGLTKEIIANIFDYVDFIIHLPSDDESNIVVDDTYIDCLSFLFEKNKTNRRIKYVSIPGGGYNSQLLSIIPEEVVVDTFCMNRAGNGECGVKYEYSGSLTCGRTYNRLDQNVLLPNGDLLLCCQDWGMKYILGNLKQNSYIDILEGETANKIRKEMIMGKRNMLCNKCNYAIELID